MRRLSVIFAALVAAWFRLPAASGQEPSFRVDVRLVNVTATVKDGRGALVGDLEREDFTLLAAGVPQQIAIFERQTDRPLSVVLLFDSSPSVAKELKFEQEAALRFVRSLLGTGSKPADTIAVYKFSDYVDEAQAFTHSPERLERAILSIRPHGGTSVYDALYLAAQKLEGREGRKVIVIITDGGDTTSTIKFADALEAVQLGEAVVYSIIVVPVTSDAGRNLGGENALKTMSAATGGIAFREHTETGLETTFRQIERDLRTQYLLGFYPRGIPPSPEHFRRIEVQVDRPGARVLARSGYFVGPEEISGKNVDSQVSVAGQPPRERQKEPKPSPPAGKIPKSLPRKDL